MWTQELRLLGKCERCITPRARQTTDRCVRYANTLLVNLNNRIYFRDHQPPGVGDSADFIPSDRVCATAQTSLRFAIPEPDSFQLHTITPTVDLGIGEGDDTMVNSTLVSSISRYSCLFIPISLDGSGSLSSPALRNAICILMTLSQSSTVSLLLIVNRTTCMGCAATATQLPLVVASALHATFHCSTVDIDNWATCCADVGNVALGGQVQLFSST